MTTIAYRDGVMASDSYSSTREFLWYSMRKIVRHECGALAGAAGSVVWCQRLLEAFAGAEPKDLTRLFDVCRLTGGGEALIVTESGSLYVIEKVIQFHIRDRYYAIGSGGAYAIAAMDAGATADQAVRIGIKRDPYSSGRVQIVKHGG